MTALQRQFLALEPRWIGGARLFKLYLRRGVLHAACVGGQSRGLLERVALWGELAFVFRSTVRIDRQLEGSYDAIDLPSPALIARDGRNFRIASAEIERVILKPRRLWSVPKVWRRACSVGFRHRGDGHTRVLWVRWDDAEPLRGALAAMAFRVEGP